MFLPFVVLFLGAPFTIVALFGSVFLHELGHSLVARSFGIQVLDITFWPLGGMARMSHMPESPKVEGLVAIAGPAVNFVLAAISVPLIALAAIAQSGFVTTPPVLFLGQPILLHVVSWQRPV